MVEYGHERRPEAVEVCVAGEGKPVVFDFPPKDFDPVQFWRVGRQVVQHNAPGCPDVPVILYRLTGVPVGIVQNHDARPGVVPPGRKPVQGVNDLLAANPAGCGMKERPVVPGQEAEDIEPSGRERREFTNGADRLPGVGYRGERIKPRTIEVEQIDEACFGETPKALLGVLLTGKGRRITTAFQGSTAAVPGVMQSFLRRGAGFPGTKSFR